MAAKKIWRVNNEFHATCSKNFNSVFCLACLISTQFPSSYLEPISTGKLCTQASKALHSREGVWFLRCVCPGHVCSLHAWPDPQLLVGREGGLLFRTVQFSTPPQDSHLINTLSRHLAEVLLWIFIHQWSAPLRQDLKDQWNALRVFPAMASSKDSIFCSCLIFFSSVVFSSLVCWLEMEEGWLMIYLRDGFGLYKRYWDML